jgi:uncharacterized protein YbjQ (UPF0145 family)
MSQTHDPFSEQPKRGFRLPWIKTPEEMAADRDRKLNAERVREAEMRRSALDLSELARGGIPTQATERLREIADSGGHEGVLFTSDLAPEEAGLLRSEGYRPLGLVTGSAVYNVGTAYASAYSDCEVQVLSSAYNEATRLAVGRMRLELKHIGAHGVVGVRLSLVRHEWAEGTVEVQVVGTAVVGPFAAPAEPWMCDLSGQEWWALYRAGYIPAGLVWGHCHWFVLTTQDDEMVHRYWRNIEMAHWSQALSSARHRAMANVQRQAKAFGATGVAGVRIERRLDEIRLTGPGENPVYEYEHHNLVMSVIGTAIKIRPRAPTSVVATVPVLSLRDGDLDLAPSTIAARDMKVE